MMGDMGNNNNDLQVSSSGRQRRRPTDECGRASAKRSRLFGISPASRTANKLAKINELGSDLVSNLSEFLATRNVISVARPNLSLGCRQQRCGYSKMIDEAECAAQTSASSRKLTKNKTTSCKSSKLRCKTSEQQIDHRHANDHCQLHTQLSNCSRSDLVHSNDAIDLREQIPEAGGLFAPPLESMSHRGKTNPSKCNFYTTTATTTTSISPSSLSSSSLSSSSSSSSSYSISSLSSRFNSSPTSLAGNSPDDDRRRLGGGGGRSQRPKVGVLHLLSSLLFNHGRRRHETRSKVLIKLLRAPTVLAALFSFGLVISLLVLYTLSFHQHNRQHLGGAGMTMAPDGSRDGSAAAAAASPTNGGGAAQATITPTGSIAATAAAAAMQPANSTQFGAREADLMSRQILHHINSRQLQQSAQNTTKLLVPHDRARDQDQDPDLDLDQEQKSPSQQNHKVPATRASVARAPSASERANGHLVAQMGQDDTSAKVVGQVGAPTSKQPAGGTTLVTGECATYEAATDECSATFRAIPFASRPVGFRRWARPRPSWLDPELCPALFGSGRSVRYLANETAARGAQHCVQMSPSSRRLSGSEDCLYLDIFAPLVSASNQAPANRSHQQHKAAPAQLLPVMFYIHGGFLAYGSNGAHDDEVNWMRARPSGKLAAELNVILVAPNYRLQALGFMALGELARGQTPDGAEGNYGLWDQLAALEWVRRNIESFGGDPENVVIFGPDSASSLPLALISGGGGGGGGDEPDARSAPLGAATTGRQLFRAAWLTDPTVYYELPYELANQHYARLVESQSICSSASLPAASQHQNQLQLQNQIQILNQSQNQNQSQNNNNNNNNKPKTMLNCLINLSAEQVVREYLGKDDPAFRLDDQSSLPLRNIFADQFVTVDGELVQAAYPFAGPAADPAPPKTPQTHPTAAANDDRRPRNRDGRDPATPPDATRYSSKASSLLEEDQLAGANEKQRRRRQRQAKELLIGSLAQAPDYWPCPRNLYQWKLEDFQRYVGASLNSFSAETYKRASEIYQVPDRALELAQQANNSSSSSNNNNNNNNRSNNDNNTTQSANGQAAAASPDMQFDPIGVYLTMVSDIRQICPINELTRSLRSNGNSVRRYVIEWRPSGQLVASLGSSHKSAPTGCGLDAGATAAAETKDDDDDDENENENDDSGAELTNVLRRANQQQPRRQQPAAAEQPNGRHKGDAAAGHLATAAGPRYAFHYWDLMAFFGFDSQANANLRPHQDDLEFQRRVRSMVKQFVWNLAPASSEQPAPADGFILFGANKSVSQVPGAANEFRHTECKMWRQFLKPDSYAWLS